MIRRAAIVLSLMSALCLASALPASASTYTEEQAFVAKINYERTVRGYRALRVRSDLTSVARKHSARMASKGAIYHNRYLGQQVTAYWYEIGENVGCGTTVSGIHRAFMNSSGHRANILYRRYDSVGVGVVHAGGRIYVTEVFANF